MKIKGFTLIELLAVIVILAVIALITTPIILGVIESSRRKAFEDTGYGVIEAIRGYYVDKLSEEGVVGENIFTFPNSGLKISGTEPAGGEARLYPDGKIEIAIHDNRFCVTKSVDVDEVTSDDYMDDCTLESLKAYMAPPSTFQNKIIAYRKNVTTISFVNTNKVPSKVITSFDISKSSDGSIMAWIEKDPDHEGMYQFTIGSKGKIYADENIEYLFGNYESVIEINNLKKLDTSKVTNMKQLFYNCKVLSELDLSNFKTSNVVNMSGMFNNLKTIEQLNLENFDTSNVTDMSYMFQWSDHIKSLNVSHFDTSKVTNMSGMFQGMTNLTDLDVSHFDTSNVTDMSYMFQWSNKISPLDVSNWNTSKVTNMKSMFQGVNVATVLDVSNFDTGNVTDMSSMFNNVKNVTELDLSKWNTSKVTDMSYMFQWSNNLTKIDVSHFNTSSVTNMESMFEGVSQLKELNVSSFDTSEVVNMNKMFSILSAIKVLDLSNFNTSNVTSMEEMFNVDTQLKTIYVSDDFTVDKVTSSNNMFFYNLQLVGGIGTKYDASHVDKEYARVDSASNKGYFTKK